MNAIWYAAGILGLSAASMFAETAAATDPVGFITLDAAGAPTGALSIKSLGMTRSIDYQGIAETKATNTFVDNEATWTDDQFNGAAGKYYIEISSGTLTGATFDVADTVAGTKTIQTVQDLPAGLAAPFSFKVRKHWTLSSVFGTGSSLVLNPGDSSTADQVLVYAGGSYLQYFYQTGTGWREASAGATDQADTPLYPDDALIINRKQGTPVNVVLMGAVKMGQTSFPINPGTNIVGNPCAAEMTLNSCGLLASGFTSGDGSTSDQVLFFNGTGYDVYYYQSGGFGTGWRKATDPGTDAGGKAIPVGSAVIIKRSGASGFDWKVPQHPASI